MMRASKNFGIWSKNLNGKVYSIFCHVGDVYEVLMDRKEVKCISSAW